MKLTKLANEYAVARAQPEATVPEGFLSGPGFRTVSRTGDELSLVGPADAIAGMDRVETGWTAIKVHGPFAFDDAGIKAVEVALAVIVEVVSGEVITGEAVAADGIPVDDEGAVGGATAPGVATGGGIRHGPSDPRQGGAAGQLVSLPGCPWAYVPEPSWAPCCWRASCSAA